MRGFFHSRVTLLLKRTDGLMHGYCVLLNDVGPVVSDVWPLYGPQAGGTIVTVTGSELTGSQEPVIVFVSSNFDHFITLSTNATEQYRTSKRYIVRMISLH